jgi:hypothetical protein
MGSKLAEIDIFFFFRSSKWKTTAFNVIGSELALTHLEDLSFIVWGLPFLTGSKMTSL